MNENKHFARCLVLEEKGPHRIDTPIKIYCVYVMDNYRSHPKRVVVVVTTSSKRMNRASVVMHYNCHAM